MLSFSPILSTFRLNFFKKDKSKAASFGLHDGVKVKRERPKLIEFSENKGFVISFAKNFLTHKSISPFGKYY